MFARHLIDSVAQGQRSLDLRVRLNWYRSLPLDCLEQLEVSLDGARLDPARTTVEVAGNPWPADGDDRWWPVRDAARVHVELTDVPSAGTHRVEVVIGTRIPYLVSPDGHAAVIVDRAAAEVTR